jgi:predicted Rossmann fold flavoprotein
VKHYRIPFHEKHQGQLFCDESAKDIIQMLFSECQQGGVQIQNPVTISAITRSQDAWELATSQGSQKTRHLVIATGGLPVPAIGASDYALNVAKQFDIPVNPVRPALVPLSFTAGEFLQMSDLSGVSIPVTIASGQKGKRYGTYQFEEDLLLTHKGLSGPAVLQASSYWIEGETIHINWLGKQDDAAVFKSPDANTRSVDSLLADLLPQRFAKLIAEQFDMSQRNWAEISKKDRERLRNYLTHAEAKPAGTLGWKKAEVMLGGVDTKALDGKTMMSKQHPNLFFIGECVDVTGHLGGHNFQWAWSSAYVCATAIGKQ